MSDTARAPRHPRTGSHRWSFPIGRVSGIEIRLHWTFFLIVALFALAGAGPDGPGVVSMLSWLVLIFASVVVHELSHCFVGRTRGAVVHEIVLLPIGGVSKLERMPERPTDELAMAIAGPAASVGLAALAGLVALGLGQELLPIDFLEGSFVARLFWFNLIVAGFNLLPAFPLDGGRVLRALLERRYDLERATRIAARVGRAVAIAFVVVGIFFDLWIAIIGVFVYFGASAEEAATIVHVRLLGHRVADTMLLEPHTVWWRATTSELAPLLRTSAQRAFPVVGPDGYLGMVDAPQIEHGAPGQTAAELAERDAPVAAATDGVEDLLPSVVNAPARALAVIEGRRVVGLLRVEDVQHLLTEEHRPSTPNG